MKPLLLFALLFSAGCFAQVDPSAPDVGAAGAGADLPGGWGDRCLAVECGWTDIGTCEASSTFKSSEGVLVMQDWPVNACWYYDTSCVLKDQPGVPDHCPVPDKCKRVQVTCQPVANPGRP